MANYRGGFVLLVAVGSSFLLGCGQSEPAPTRKAARNPASATPKSEVEATPASASPSTPAAMAWGELTGKIVYDGTPPTPEPLVITADVPAFGNLGLVNESLLVDKETRGIANVVVFVRTKDVKVHPDLEKAAGNEAKLVQFDNKGGRFVPHILPVWIGKQTLCLCNSDKVSHNSNLAPFGDQAINPLLPPAGKVEHNFSLEQSVPVQVKCNIHPWMVGYILPRSNPYVAVTGNDGSFALGKLPAGTKLEFQVWHEKAGPVATPDWPRGRFERTLQAGANDLGTIKLPPSLFEK
jgi:hypothetical protein